VGEILVRVETCGVCRTDLHVVEGELPVHREGIIPGHEIVGRVEKLGPGVERWKGGDRVGVAWLHSACGHCPYCLRGDENLCTAPRFTGYDVPGGYAEFTVARADFVYPIAEELPAAEASIFLCAGIIGYRALVRSEIRPGQPIGLYGFGGSAHIVLQVARSWGCEVSVCTRGADHQALAREMGAVWVGDAAAIPPRPLRASILFAPAGDLVPVALSALDRGGTLALAGIYMTPIPEMDYGKLLFNEHSLRSVTANTRADGRALMKLAADIPLHAGTQEFALEDANIALLKLKRDELTSAAAVLRIGGSRPSAQDKDEVCRPADGI
jgi:propanol-preferring alcohol dehydrogenase